MVFRPATYQVRVDWSVLCYVFYQLESPVNTTTKYVFTSLVMQENDTPELQQEPLRNESVNSLYSLMWLPVIELERTWSEAEFQSKLLCLLIGWLSLNVLLIHIAWSRYGSRLCDSFGRGTVFSPSLYADFQLVNYYRYCIYISDVIC